jgi:CYTH domain-containing protein
MPDAFGKYAKREYERRWLLRALPRELDPNRPWARITDHYLDGTRFRVRERVALESGDVVWKLTHKFPERDGAHDRTVITNNYLTRDEYDRFCRLPGREVVKHRWILEYGGARFGVDAYLGPLSGLITAEREYASHEELLASPAPAFDGVDVTDPGEFIGGALAGKAFEEVRALVERLLARR